MSGILVHLDTIWGKFQGKGHSSKFKVQGRKKFSVVDTVSGSSTVTLKDSRIRKDTEALYQH